MGSGVFGAQSEVAGAVLGADEGSMTEAGSVAGAGASVAVDTDTHAAQRAEA
jgi:hypothetical protein